MSDVWMAGLTCCRCRAGEAQTKYGCKDDEEVEEMEMRFEKLGTHMPRRTTQPAANVARNLSGPGKMQSPSRFRLAGLFRSQSRVWSAPAAATDGATATATATFSSEPEPPHPPSILKKKQKMRVLV